MFRVSLRQPRRLLPPPGAEAALRKEQDEAEALNSFISDLTTKFDGPARGLGVSTEKKKFLEINGAGAKRFLAPRNRAALICLFRCYSKSGSIEASNSIESTSRNRFLKQ